MSNSKRIVGYFGSWSVYRPDKGNYEINYIDPTLCTHLIYTFVGLNTETNNVKILDPWADLPDGGGRDGYNKFNQLKSLNPNVKTLIAIGGWNEGSTKYSKLCSSSESCETFANNVITFVKKYKFDGFEIDWEYPAQRGGDPNDVKNFVQLLKIMRGKFNKEGLILSAAVAAAESSASKSYDIPAVSEYLDFINVMSYDLKGAWDFKTGMNAGLEPASDESGNDLKLNVRACIQYWLESGAPKEKLNLGIPFFGRTFTLSDSKNNGVGSAASGPGSPGPYTREPGMLSYNEIVEVCREENGWTIIYDKERCVPYAFKNDQWVSFDNPESIKKKAEFIKELDLGGAMIWSLESDDFRGISGEKNSLLKTLNSGLK